MFPVDAIVEIHRASGLFKLARVLGPSRTPGKIRVEVWSAASACYSNPQAVKEDVLSAIDVAQLTPRQARVYRLAKGEAYRQRIGASR